MKDLIDRAKSAILHHGTTGFEEIEGVNLYANENDDTPTVSGFAVHIDELPEPVIFQGSGYTAGEDMARAYVAMRRIIPEMIERLEGQEKEIERFRKALEAEIHTAQPPMAAIRDVLEDMMNDRRYDGDMRQKFWRIVHNVVAHPLLATDTEWAADFHDWTAEKAWPQ